MCEWLSCREWCDVRLQCGGRWFPAHRAVLASVSDFLRQILLSCHTEESPTSILLPDFDLDALSSVLYYIYNGEVVIQKQKLEMFMEIIEAMQIFVDEKYLSKTFKSDFLSSNCRKSKVSGNFKMFSLGDSLGGQYIALKKGRQNMDHALTEHCESVLDLQDKQIGSRIDDMSRSCFGNVQTTHGDRQRSFFLRDLFIETYPRNGNANGRTPGVPAIPNECYRGATSVLLTNANGKHLAVDDKISGLHQKMLVTSQLSETPYFVKSQHFLQRLGLHGDPSLINLAKFSEIRSYDANSTTDLSSKLLSPSSLLTNCNVAKNYFGNRWTDEFCTSVNQKQPLSSRNTLQSVSKSHDKKELNSISVFKSDTTTIVNNGLIPKGAILNQVMESPWCSRKPDSYRPFRRKAPNKPDLGHDVPKDSPINDDNNNIPINKQTEVTERISPITTVEFVNPNANDKGHKCITCNQVFSNPESLAVHTRRHSSIARYSCTECSKSFSQLRNFKYHMSIHRGTREFAATCTVCGKYFNDKGYLSSHMKIHRNRKEYKCPQCPKSFNQRVAYNMHVRIHTGIKPHVCSECGKAFSRKMLLKQHQRTHSGERPYACAHCDKRFADRSNMTLHLRLHTGIKPFSCSLCPKSFTKKHHLKSHLNFHTGAKPYSCPRCKLAFTQSSNMRTHYKKCKAPEPTHLAIAETSTS